MCGTSVTPGTGRREQRIKAHAGVLLGKLADRGGEAGGFVPVAEKAKAEALQHPAYFFECLREA